MRLGIDLGGTKTEIIALDNEGGELYRKRVLTPRVYEDVVTTLAGLVKEAETTLGQTGTVGMGIPGTVSARTGLVKNANHQILNGHALDKDLSAELGGRPVRCMNDANCLAVSEAVDGAGAGYKTVFAVILGTGCGAGFAFNGRGWAGPNLVAGEFGHNPLPWMADDELPGLACWCGKRGCIEKYISGTGFEQDYARHAVSEQACKAPEIIAAMRDGEEEAIQALERYADRLARSLAHVVNLVDPDVIVLGGGMSNVQRLYEKVPPLLSRYVFGGEADTPVLKSRHGDSSGVRGAAWLWPDNEGQNEEMDDGKRNYVQAG